MYKRFVHVVSQMVGSETAAVSFVVVEAYHGVQGSRPQFVFPFHRISYLAMIRVFVLTLRRETERSSTRVGFALDRLRLYRPTFFVSLFFTKNFCTARYFFQMRLKRRRVLEEGVLGEGAGSNGGYQ